MAILIKCSSDVENILDASHREIIREYVDNIQEPIWEDAYNWWHDRVFRSITVGEGKVAMIQQRMLDDVGYPIYLTDEEELWKESDELYFDSSGIIHDYSSDPDDVRPSWEAITLAGDDLYQILWLRDNDCGITYFLPKALVTNENLKKLIERELS